MAQDLQVQAEESASVAENGAPDFLRTALQAFYEYQESGDHPERRKFEQLIGYSVGAYQRRSTVWRFIDAAVNGEDIFSNGFALYPHILEVENGIESDKLKYRRSQADYHNFAGHVCDAAWDCIVASKDLIQRHSDDARLNAFWQDTDRRGTAIIDFLEFPQRQLRQFGTAWIFVDRPAVPLTNLLADLSPDNRPYAYSVPTQNVVWWDFDDFGVLTSVVVKTPAEDAKPEDPAPIRVWTREAWADFVPTDKSNYAFLQGGPNPIGEVPCVLVFNNDPGPGKAMGHSEMLDVCKKAQTVYNIDSEAREIERKCAAFLAMPVKDSTSFTDKKIEIGLDNVLLYDGTAGKPEWLSPNLDILARLVTRRQQVIDDCYEMAQLRGMVGSNAAIQTKSGFHAEVEFAKTEKRIARHAAGLETAEQRIARLVLRYYGVPSNAMQGLFTIVYPREFGLRDIETVMTRFERIVAMNLGDDCNRVELSALFRTLYPRMAADELQKLVDSGVKALGANRQAQAQQDQTALNRVSQTRIRDLLNSRIGG